MNQLQKYIVWSFIVQTYIYKIDLIEPCRYKDIAKSLSN